MARRPGAIQVSRSDPGLTTMSDLASNQAAGRYAPSPTGELHFGSLVAALASYLHARSRGAAWYMRIEDLDPEREVTGSAGTLLHALEAFGLTWDGPVLYQSTRGKAYQQALDRLLEEGAAFPCGCTRREVQSGKTGPEGPIYSGTCRYGVPPGRLARTLRVRVDDHVIRFNDGVFGSIEQNLSRAVGDFVVRRGDGHVAYQLAVVLDDAYQNVTEVVRGADLLTSTPRQMLLQSLLGLPHNSYWHVPLLIDADGRKLGKSSGAPLLDVNRPAPLIVSALRVLGQRPPSDLQDAGRDGVLDWAVLHWNAARVPRHQTMHWNGIND